MESWIHLQDFLLVVLVIECRRKTRRKVISQLRATDMAFSKASASAKLPPVFFKGLKRTMAKRRAKRPALPVGRRIPEGSTLSQWVQHQRGAVVGQPVWPIWAAPQSRLQRDQHRISTPWDCPCASSKPRANKPSPAAGTSCTQGRGDMRP